MLAKLTLPLSQRTTAYIVAGICFCTVVIDSALFLLLASLWISLKWEPESEWDEWRMNGVRVFVGLVAGYFVWAAFASLVGLIGALQRIPSFLRFARDNSILDWVFTLVFTIVVTFCASRSNTRTLLCEQLSRQPELLRNLANSGLNFENCELWFENLVFIFVMVMGVCLVMRLQFCFTLSNLYSRILRRQRFERMGTPLDAHPRRILLLPPPSDQRSSGDVLVYAPVPQAASDALELGATEAWVSHSRRSDPSRARSGQIRLAGPDDSLYAPPQPALHTSPRRESRSLPSAKRQT